MDEKYWDFLDIFAQVPADYEKAEDMLKGGMDINAHEEDKGKEAENLLSACITDFRSDPTSGAEESAADGMGPVAQMTEWFLRHGFDAARHNGLAGGLCVAALHYAGTDGEDKLTAAKMLFTAGASATQTDPDGATPGQTLETHASFYCMESDLHEANICEALIRVCKAAESGADGSGIHVYTAARGKKLQAVYMNACGEIFPDRDLRLRNCFNTSLYLHFEDIYLCISRDCDLICYDNMPERVKDVSGRFAPLLGMTLTGFEWKGRHIMHGKKRRYTQNASELVFDGGSLRVQSNFGETSPEEDSSSYVLIVQEKEGGERSEPGALSQKEKLLVCTLIKAGIKRSDVFALFSECGETRIREKLLSYALFKMPWLDAMDAFSYCFHLRRTLLGEDFEYYPQLMWVGYTGKRRDDLAEYVAYNVCAVCGTEADTLTVWNENGEPVPVDAADTVLLKPVKTHYGGVRDENGKITMICDGFKSGEELEIKGVAGGDFLFKGGRRCPAVECYQTQYVRTRRSVPKITHDEAIDMLCRAFEWGETDNYLFSRMSRDVRYISRGKNMEITGRKQVCEYILSVAKKCVFNGTYVEAVPAVTAFEDDKGHGQGEKFVLLSYSHGARDGVFVKEEKGKIACIEVCTEYPAFEPLR